MKRLRCLSLMLALGMGPCVSSQAADEPSPPAEGEGGGSSTTTDVVSGSTVTAAVLESKIKEIASTVDLDEASKAKLTEQYRKAMSSLEAAKSYDAKAAAYAEALETAPAQAAELRKQIEALQTQVGEAVEPIDANLTIRELEQRLAKEQADAAAVEAKLSEMEKELENWSRRPAEARQRISDAKAALEELDLEAVPPAPELETPALAEVRRWVLETRRRELRAEILMLDRELLSQGVRQQLLEAYRDKAALDLKLIQARKRYLEDQLNQRRRAEAAQATAEAEVATREAADKHALVKALARENAALTEELSNATKALDEIDDQLAALEAQSKRIGDEFRSTRQRLEISGLSRALGQVLIDRRQQLPDPRIYRRAAKRLEAEIAEINLRQIRNNEERLRLRDLDAYLDGIMAELPPEQRSADLRAELRGLLERRPDLLDQAHAADDAYLRALSEVDFAADQLLKTVQSYEDFLAERLLWVRSAAPVGIATITDLPAALAWALSPLNWLEVGQVLLYELKSSPLFWLLLLLGVGLLWKRRAMYTALFATAEPLRRVRTEGFRYTLKGLVLTALLAAPLPLLTAAIGSELSTSVEATAFTKAVGAGILAVSTGLFSIRAFWLLCITGGVADRHFHWSGRVLAVIRKNFAWAILVLTPLAFVASMMHNFDDLRYSGSLGRIALVGLMIGLAVLTARLVHPTKGVLQNFIAQHPDRWVSRLRNLWYPLIVAAPLALVVLTLAGYTYTAGTLLKSLVSEFWLVLALTVLHQSIVRWLIVIRHRLALQATLERRSARTLAEDRVESRAPGSPGQVEEPEVDLASLDEQTRRLINALIFFGAAVALWGIWSDVLPAFGVFEDVALWHHTAVIDGKEEIVPVTLASIGLVLLIAAVATVAARNLPALIEIVLLRTSVSAGSRYAVKTLTGYLITAIAVVSIFGTLGLSWGQVQWLVAALGVGIGFGLQEIVANFISGIIVLFERPVRVGDVVTVGDTTGTVTRIQIRAITIRNWDKQEFLVPNKEFITGRLLNWTLTDTVNRVVINVGVDYGSDVALALRLLAETVRENERVLEDPAPLITFEGFGDNALNLVVRCYLASLDERLGIISELHQAINDKLRVNGISIAFPQRDVHLSTAKPLDVRVHQASPRNRAGTRTSGV